MQSLEVRTLQTKKEGNTYLMLTDALAEVAHVQFPE